MPERHYKSGVTCTSNEVSFEVDYSGQKVIKSECRVQAETATCLTMDQNGHLSQMPYHAQLPALRNVG